MSTAALPMFVASRPLAAVVTAGGMKRVDSNDMFSFLDCDSESATENTCRRPSIRRVLKQSRSANISDSDSEASQGRRPQTQFQGSVSASPAPVEIGSSSEKSTQAHPAMPRTILNAKLERKWSASGLAARDRFNGAAPNAYYDFDDADDDDFEVAADPHAAKVQTSAPVRIPSRELNKLSYGGCGTIIF
eukprot:tig00000042_g15652.t1